MLRQDSQGVIFPGFHTGRRYPLLFPQWITDLHLHSLCGEKNRAHFGSCLASSGKRLEIMLGITRPINPGLVFSVSVWKVDFYNQTVTSDSSTFLKIQTEPSNGIIGPLLGAAVSGETVFQLFSGHATVAVALQPYIAMIEADVGLTQLAGEAIVFAEGLDNESLIVLRYVFSSPCDKLN
jgi:hypothetical protein